MSKLKALGLLASIALAPFPLEAQRGDRSGPPVERQEMERRFRERLATVVKERLELNDEQMRRLADVNQRFDRIRRDLVRGEIGVRRELREELGKPSPSDDRVAQLIADQLRIERERLQTIEEEQGELAKFLTAVQRAKYLGIQDQMRRQVDQLRGRPPFMSDSAPPGRPGSPGRRRPPPGP